jgi:hypothetical protein
MSKKKYFNGESGVYYDFKQNKLFDFKHVENYETYNFETKKLTKIKKYNLYCEVGLIDKTAVKHNDDLILIGSL